MTAMEQQLLRTVEIWDDIDKGGHHEESNA